MAVQNVQIGVVWGRLRVTHVIGNVTIRLSTYDLLFDFNRNYASFVYRFRDTASYLSKVADSIHHTCIWRPRNL